MIYLKYFENASVIGNGVEVELPDVSYLHNKNVLFIPGSEGTATVKVNSTTGEIEVESAPDYSTMYLTFEAIESGTFKFSGATSAHTLSYSLDDGTTWTALAHNTNTPTIAAGSKIMWKGTLTPGSSGIGKFSATGNFNAYGNAMSLLYGDNFIGQTDLTGKNYAFCKLFYNNAKIVNAQNLILPATTLAQYCYQYMFYNCSALSVAPALPATSLTNYCYEFMFQGCTSLLAAPTLPATTLAIYCYEYMFADCTSLATAPTLPSTTMKTCCYRRMFKGCTSLTAAPALPSEALANGCYTEMFGNCTHLTVAPVLPAMTLVGDCYSYMFQGCTSLTTAPELPATSITPSCYSLMFNGCTSLTTAPLILPAMTLQDECYWKMFAGCTSLTTAPELPATTLRANSYCYQEMFSGCTSLSYIKAMFTTTPGTKLTKDWVAGVAATGTFVKNSAATWTTTGASGIPTGWTVVDA